MRGQRTHYKNYNDNVQHEPDNSFFQFMDRALNTQESSYVSFRVRNRHDRGNMRLQSLPGTQPVYGRILYFLGV